MTPATAADYARRTPRGYGLHTYCHQGRREVIEQSPTGLYHVILGNHVHVYERLSDAVAHLNRS